MSKTDLIIIVLAVIGIFFLIVFLVWIFERFNIRKNGYHYVTPQRLAGRQGEVFVSGLIQEVLTSEDIYLENIPIVFDGMQSELDNVIINSNGIFIIEVKNYYGEMTGEEDDEEWVKIKVTNAGSYPERIRNPIQQVKRQIYILSHLLEALNIKCRINGYVFFVNANSPIERPYILRTLGDIEQAIHSKADEFLPKEEQDKMKEMFCFR